MNEGLVIGLPVGNFVLLLCHDVVCIIRIMRALILPLGKSSIYSTKPYLTLNDNYKPFSSEIRAFHLSRYPLNSSILEIIIASSVYSLNNSTQLGLIVTV